MGESHVVDVSDPIGTLALILLVGLVARLAADALRVPEMVLLVGAGALLGPSVLGFVDVPFNSEGAHVLFTLGVSFILFHGGLQTSLRVLRRTAVGLGLLAVPGMLITAAVTGAVATIVFDLPLLHGLLIGAVLAPTDPAILIPLFDRLGLRKKLSQTIVAESALNDTTGAVLVLALASGNLGGDTSLSTPVFEFVIDLAISTGLGVEFGIVLSLAVSSGRAGVWRESSAIAIVAVVAGGFVSIDFAGGSGYLGAFLAGLIVGNMDLLRLRMHGHHEQATKTLVTALADVVVILVFIVVGANIPFSTLWDDLLPVLAVVATLLLVARPLAVAACLLPDRRGRWTRRELVFMVWSRETGVVPAALAGILVGLNVPDADLVTITVAAALVVTLLVQTTTKPWLARRLDLLEHRLD